jgi:hypothetical protein
MTETVAGMSSLENAARKVSLTPAEQESAAVRELVRAGPGPR